MDNRIAKSGCAGLGFLSLSPAGNAAVIAANGRNVIVAAMARHADSGVKEWGDTALLLYALCESKE